MILAEEKYILNDKEVYSGLMCNNIHIFIC